MLQQTALTTIYWLTASCLINAQPLPAHSPAADDNSLIGCTSYDLTDDWSLTITHFVDSLYPFRYSFGCVLLSNQMFENNVPYDNTTPIYLINLL